jgi:hypothetical protein
LAEILVALRRRIAFTPTKKKENTKHTHTGFRVCVYVCVFVYTHTYTHIHVYTNLHAYSLLSPNTHSHTRQTEGLSAELAALSTVV